MRGICVQIDQNKRNYIRNRGNLKCDIYNYLVTDGRVNGNLNLSRAMGDLEYKKDSTLAPEKQIITVAPDISVNVIMTCLKFI